MPDIIRERPPNKVEISLIAGDEKHINFLEMN
jgi:hypothetical protein